MAVKQKSQGKQEVLLSNDDKARLLDIVSSNPDDVIRRLAKAEGFPWHATEKFLKRLRVTHANFKAAVVRLGRRELVDTIQDKIALGLHYMDDFSMSAMDGKDLAIMLGILIEKQQLLEGKPTAILSFEERRKMPELMSAWMREATRRGITLDMSAVEVTETFGPRAISGDTIQEEAVNATARRMKKLPEEQ